MTCFRTALLVFLCAILAMAAAQTYEEINSNVTKDNTEWFQAHLRNCPPNEVRCLWFLDDHIKVGMVMTIDLQNDNVHTVREVYDWARQGAENRKMSHSQISTIREILPLLPPGIKDLPFGKGVHISFWQDKKLHTLSYNRKDMPIILQRLYDAGGGYIDGTFAK